MSVSPSLREVRGTEHVAASRAPAGMNPTESKESRVAASRAPTGMNPTESKESREAASRAPAGERR